MTALVGPNSSQPLTSMHRGSSMLHINQQLETAAGLVTQAVRHDGTVALSHHPQTARADSVIELIPSDRVRPKSAEHVIISVLKNPRIDQRLKNEVIDLGRSLFQLETSYRDFLNRNKSLLHFYQKQIKKAAFEINRIEQKAVKAKRTNYTQKEKEKIANWQVRSNTCQTKLDQLINSLNHGHDSLLVTARSTRNALTRKAKNLLSANPITEQIRSSLPSNSENLRLDSNHKIDEAIINWLLEINGDTDLSQFNSEVLGVARMNFAFFHKTGFIDTQTKALFDLLNQSDKMILRNVFNRLHKFHETDCFQTLIQLKQTRRASSRRSEAIRKEILLNFVPLIENWNGSLANHPHKKIDFLEMAFYILSSTDPGRTALNIDFKTAPNFYLGSQLKEDEVLNFYDALSAKTGLRVEISEIRAQCTVPERGNPNRIPTLEVHHFFHKSFGGGRDLINAWVFPSGIHGVAHFLDDVYRLGCLKTTDLDYNLGVFLKHIDFFTGMQNSSCPRVQTIKTNTSLSDVKKKRFSFKILFYVIKKTYGTKKLFKTRLPKRFICIEKVI